MNGLRFLLCTAVLFLFTLFPTHAQSTATLAGQFLDPSGLSISGVEVKVERLPSDGTVSASTRSDAEGRFTLSLAPGRYRVRAIHSSFAAMETEVTLTGGESREWAARMRLESLSASVIVSAAAQPLPLETVASPVAVVTKEDIRERQETFLAPALVQTPGIHQSKTGRNGGFATLFLDGGNSNFTKVLLDGATLNQPGGFVEFSNLTLDHVEKVEVVHGAASALFGSDAMTGVIQVFSQRGSTRIPQFDLLAEGGSFATGRGSARFSGQLGRFDYSAAAARFEAGGIGPNDEFRVTTLAGNFGYQFSETNQLRLTLRNNTSAAGIQGQTAFTPPDLDEEGSLRNFTTSAIWDFATGNNWRHHVAVRETYLRQQLVDLLSDYYLDPDPFGICVGVPRAATAVATTSFCDFPFTSNNRYNRAGFNLQTTYVNRFAGITFGYDYEVENGSANSAHARRNNQGGYVETRWQLKRLTITAGARVEANASFGVSVVPRGGLVYALRTGGDEFGATRLRFSFGQGINEPSFSQSFSVDPCFPGNLDLRPERTRTIYAGVDQMLGGDRVRVSVDFFDNLFRDIISFAFGQSNGLPPPGCGFSFGTFFNTDRSRARGVLLAVETRPASWLRISGNYTHTASKVLESPNAFDPTQQPGMPLLRRPANSGNVAVNVAWRRMQWNLQGTFVGTRVDSDFLFLGLTSNPGYARVDLATSYEFTRRVTAFGRLENVFNEQYQETLGYPAFGRGLRVGMKFRLGGE